MTVAASDALIAVRSAPDNWGDGAYLLACAQVLADEVDHLRAELAATRDTLAELNEVLAESFPQIDAVIHDHPAAHLKIVD